jgi:hypothetical protein
VFEKAEERTAQRAVKFNPNHEPSGTPAGGQFAPGDGGGSGGGDTPDRVPSIPISVPPGFDDRVLAGQMQAAVDQLPDEIRQFLHVDNVKIQLLNTMPADAGAQVIGDYKAAQIRVALTNRKGEKIFEPVRTLLHEIGHAVDHGLEATDPDEGIGLELRAAMQAGAARLNNRELKAMGHYFKNDKESFAEVFAHVYGSATTSGNIGRQRFGSVFKEAIGVVENVFEVLGVEHN